MNLSFVMCYRDFDDEWRRRSYYYCRPWYEQAALRLGADFVLDSGGGGHAAAINRGVQAAIGSIIVLVDSDSLVPIDRILAAAELAQKPGLVVPHDRFCYLTPDASEQVFAGRDPFSFGAGDCHWIPGEGVGNVVVFSRDTWAAVGGYDERFYAWGGDDTAFHLTLEALVAPTRRVPGDVVHLWHERPAEESVGRPGDIEQLLQQYVRAAQNPRLVRRVASRKGWR